MASLIIGCGQCGNQLGREYWRLAEREYCDSYSRETGVASPLFHADGFARALLVDSEPKVVEATLSSSSGASFRPENALFDQSGRGNNWAMGYYASDELVRRTKAAVRREAERNGNFDSVQVLHSLAGGTGSGLTSRLLETLRDAYPRIYLTTVAVAAFSRGDTPLQHYNSAFALQFEQEFADAVVYCENDEICRTLEKRRLPNSDDDKVNNNVTTNMMNTAMAHDLAGYFFPTAHPVSLHEDPCQIDFFKSSASRTPAPPPLPFNNAALVAGVCPLPNLKFVDVRSTSGGLSSASLGPGASRERGWDELTKILSRAVPRHDANNEPIRSIASQVVMRGTPPATGPKPSSHSASRLPRRIFDSSVGCPRSLSREAQRQFRESVRCVGETYRHVAWNPSPICAAVDASPGLGQTRTVSVCSNRTHVAEPFSRVLARARLMHGAGAYTHWYRHCGCEDDDFLAAFESVQEIVAQYEAV